MKQGKNAHLDRDDSILKQRETGWCVQPVSREAGEQRGSKKKRKKERVREWPTSTRKSLYGSLNTDGHLLNITSLFPGDEKKY